LKCWKRHQMSEEQLGINKSLCFWQKQFFSAVIMIDLTIWG
jgi:hypothetical protein